MKRLVLPILILVVLVAALSQSLAATEHQKDRGAKQDAAQAKKSQADSNSTAKEVNSQVDPKAKKAKDFEELEKALERIHKNSQDEIRQWMSKRVENRIELAKEVQEQVLDELTFIRKLAVKEGAAKTTVAIDKILEDRQERFEKMLKKMKMDQERLRKREQREKRSKDGDRSTRNRDRRKN